jgi:hypothetical protein
MGAGSNHKELAKEKEENASRVRDGARPCQSCSVGIQ